ncbi:hypothetical protein GPJ59_32570 [Streptomyces bambusae]|uniref:AraC-type arabinose-binding/dimerisation domain-containing protein n=1 Tax=Streptomyces bambusae TaxID=1550616 RepID=A0ABS6ZFB8_9ACTN|nr:hypothetical protein [Streptomyces bambusae]
MGNVEQPGAGRGAGPGRSGQRRDEQRRDGQRRDEQRRDGQRRDGEWARHWRHAELPGLDLLRAHYVRHTFPRHAHDGYVLAAVTGGIEEVGLPGGTERAGPGSVVLINPEVPHTARAGAPEGWAYATLYPARGLVTDVAADITTVRGTPGFAETTVLDREGARLISEVHRAAEAGNALAADSLLRIAVARMLRRHGGALPARTVPGGGGGGLFYTPGASHALSRAGRGGAPYGNESTHLDTTQEVEAIV